MSTAIRPAREPASKPAPRNARAAGDAIACDPASVRVFRLVERIADTALSVVFLGETGVGKEVCAERLHRLSPRANAPFVRLNCAALSETLLDSELFGHERGAFTGASADKVGLLESASGGTVFLDEIGDMPLATQVKLLRVLESKEVVRVGSVRPRRIDVRVVSATHRDLPELITEGRFREDLYYRLNGISVIVPPLRERVADISPLARHFAARFARKGTKPLELAEDAVAALEAQTWPGNVRELRNVVERAVALCDAPSSRATTSLPRRDPAGPRSAGARDATDPAPPPSTGLRDEVKPSSGSGSSGRSKRARNQRRPPSRWASRAARSAAWRSSIDGPRREGS